MNPAKIFPSPRSAAAKRISKLAARREELRAESRALRAENAAAGESRSRLDAELRGALARDRAFGDATGRVKSAEKQLADLDAAVARRAEELRVTDDAIAEVEREVEQHARQHAGPLRKEIGEDAQKATARLVAAIEEIARAHADYVEVGVRSVELQRILDRDGLRTSRVPDAPAEVSAFVRLAGQHAASVRPPVLTGPSVISASEPQRLSAEADEGRPTFEAIA